MASVLRNVLRRAVLPAITKKYTAISTIHTSSLLQTPKVQQPAPDFKGTTVINGGFKDVKLSDFKGSYLILLFYPLDFTFVCPTELIAFSDRASEFESMGCKVIAVSTDSVYCHLAWTQLPRKEGGVGKLNIPLLADFNKAMCRDYDVLLESEGVALRGMFIIDKEGIVRQITINDLPVGRSVDETLRLVKAFQFTDKHGEVCPANWNPEDNAATIKPNPEGSKEYFKNVK